MDYSSLIAAIPALIQTGAGVAQSAKGNRMGRGLVDPVYTIPQSAQQALALAQNQASNFQAPGYEAFMNNLGQIMAGTTSAVNQSATSAPQALGAILTASGQQSQALNNYQGQAQSNYQMRQQRLQDALDRMAGYENRKWENDVLNPFQRKAAAAQALVGSGLQNTYAGLSDTAGILANKQAAKEERAYDEKRRDQEFSRQAELIKMLQQPTLSTSVSAPSTTGAPADSAADKAFIDFLNDLFDRSGDAYSSREEVEPRYNRYARNPQEAY